MGRVRGGGSRGGSGWGVRVDVNEVLKFLEKFKKINFLGEGVRGGRIGGGGGGQDGCERRIVKFL